jgi:hypothetical protein
MAQEITSSTSSDAVITGIFRNVAEISDSLFIEQILNDFLIPESVSEIERIEIIDVSNIGFGSNDILVIYPSRNVYMLDRPSSESLLREMQSWRLNDKRRDAENQLDAAYFYPGDKDSALASLNQVYGNDPDRNLEADLVSNALISDILTSLDRNYRGTPISLRFERDTEGFTFQLWDYEEEALAYAERPEPDTVFVGTESESDLAQELEPDSEALAASQIERTTLDAEQIEQHGFMRESRRADERSSEELIDFHVSFLSSFLNNANYQTNYHQGLGAELGMKFKPAFLVFMVSAGVTYHPLKKANPIFSENSQATNFFGIAQAGVNFDINEKIYISPTLGAKSSVYYYLEDWESDKSQSLFLTFVGAEFGLINPDIGIFARQSLATRPEGQSIIEYGIRYGF